MLPRNIYPERSTLVDRQVGFDDMPGVCDVRNRYLIEWYLYQWSVSNGFLSVVIQ